MTFRIDLAQSVNPIPLRTKVRRAAWSYCVWPLAKYLPTKLGSMARIAVLKMFGAQIGSRCLIKQGVQVLQPWELVLGDCVAIGSQVELYNHATIRIGSMSLVSQYSYLCTGSHDYQQPHFPLVSKPITIGEQCWVAADVFIGPGVSIGEGAVIGARSVVTKDMPPWTVCAGHPCKPIKERQIEEG